MTFNLMQGLMARELAADRVRDAETQRLRRDARRRRIGDDHRREVERVRASVLLVSRTSSDDRRECMRCLPTTGG